MREFDFNHLTIVLKGQVFVMTHNRLNKKAEPNTKPVELKMDKLLDPGFEDGVFLKMTYYGEDTIELKLTKDVFQRSLARDLLQLRRFKVFDAFDDPFFLQLAKRMKVHLIDQPGKVIYNIGDKADSLFIVR